MKKISIISIALVSLVTGCTVTIQNPISLKPPIIVTPDVTNAIPVVTNVVPSAVSTITYVDGDKADKGKIECYFPGLNGFQSTRFSVNDTQNLHKFGILNKGNWYPLDYNVIKDNLVMKLNGTDLYVFCPDTISPVTGKKYHLSGFFIDTTTGNMILGNSITIPQNARRGTFRLMFTTIMY